MALEQECKWCSLGQCWTHGQIRRPGGPKGGGGKGGMLGGKGGMLLQQMKQMQMMMGRGAPPQMLRQMMMCQQMMGGSAFDGGGGTSGASSNAESKNARQLVHECCQKAGMSEKFVYTVEEVQSPDSKSPEFIATLTLGEASYQSADRARSKKLAEEGAARAALALLFPDALEALQENPGAVAGCASRSATSGGNAMWQMPAWMAGALGGGQNSRGQKRKGSIAEDPKSVLMNGVQLMKGGAVSKEDITYVVQAFEDSTPGTITYLATVTIHDASGDKSFAGEVSSTKKQAEETAASVAHEHMKDVFEPLQAEHQAKKKEKLAQKNQGHLAKMKQRKQERV